MQIFYVKVNFRRKSFDAWKRFKTEVASKKKKSKRRDEDFVSLDFNVVRAQHNLMFGSVSKKLRLSWIFLELNTS